MRTLLLAGWLLVPVGFGLWHYGPGQERVQLDAVADCLARAERLAADGEWADAADAYDEALRGLPEGRVAEARRIRLERDKAWMLSHKLPEARADLEVLAQETSSDGGADESFAGQVREALANSEYYMTWLMRLEGQPRSVWEPEVESARQNYRLLAERARGKGDASAAARHAEDLESAVRLARMDLGELQGLPLPSQ